MPNKERKKTIVCIQKKLEKSLYIILKFVWPVSLNSPKSFIYIYFLSHCTEVQHSWTFLKGLQSTLTIQENVALESLLHLYRFTDFEQTFCTVYNLTIDCTFDLSCQLSLLSFSWSSWIFYKTVPLKSPKCHSSIMHFILHGLKWI